MYLRGYPERTLANMGLSASDKALHNEFRGRGPPPDGCLRLVKEWFAPASVGASCPYLSP
jgi:hypothetical protein